jgi:hypothetical protein
VPPEGWMPDTRWPAAPVGWAFWVPVENLEPDQPVGDSAVPESVEKTDAAAQSAPVSAAHAPRADESPAPISEDMAAAPIARDAEASAPGPNRETQTRALEVELESLREQLAAARLSARKPTPHEDDFVELDDARLLQQVGIYEYHHPLENAELYRQRLTQLREQIKAMVKAGTAIEASDRFSYNNSLAAGRKMTADFSKLMLRAYNAEADNCVRALRAGALASATKRLDTTVATIERLGKMMEMRVAPEYHALRITELELTADYLFKQQEEREAAREERERLREERKVEAELAAQREKLEKERAHYANTLAAMLAKGDQEGAADLGHRMAEIDAAIAENDYRAANIRAGYVYVISNIGAFGRSVVKIGLTRRLEPLDRIRELGDASVPFPFDVHALYFSNDAVTLESELHTAFADRRLNHANPRREFFFAAPEQVRDVLAEKVGNLLEYTEKPAAEQYFQSLSSWPTEHSSGGIPA